MAGAISAGCGDDNHSAIDALVRDAAPAIDSMPATLPTLAIAPLANDFGSVPVGTQSQSTTFTVTNTSVTGTTQVVAAIQGASNDYQITANTCQTLAASATCTLAVRFSPSVTGTRNGKLAITVDGASTSATLTGIGITADGVFANPSSFMFQPVVLGSPTIETDTITVTNAGGAPTGTLTVQAIGSNPTEFTKAGDTCNGQAIAPAGTCTVTVRFSPTTAGTKSAGFSIMGTPGGTVTSTFSGVAQAPAKLVNTPTALDFGTVTAGSTSSIGTVNVANLGDVASGALTADISGTNASSFSIVTSTCTGTLGASATCLIGLRYAPGSTTAETATLTVTGAPGGTVTTTLTGTGAATGMLTINPTTFAFTNTLVGQVSTATTFTITNTAGSSAGPLSVQLGGPDAAAYRVVAGTDTCTSTTLAAAGTCTVGVQFAPTSTGAKAATISVSGGGTVSASLNGNALPGAQLSIDPVSKDFGSVGIGTSSAAQLFTVTNTGGAQAGIPAIALDGGSGQFVQTNDCAAVLAPLAHCTVSVLFQPTTAGLAAATITATSNPGGMTSANVFGQGQAPTQITVIPASLTFTGTIGDVSAPQTVTLRNDGSVTSGALAITLGGANPGDYSEINNCTTLAAGSTCTITVQFAPTAAGARNATVSATGTPGGTTTVALAGSARPRIEIININAVPAVNPFDFGFQFLNTNTDALVEVRNNTSGTQAIAIVPSFPTPAQFSVGGSTCGSVGAGATCTAKITFTPTTVGIKTGSVAFSIGSGAINTATLTLGGTGKPSLTITANTSADFGNVVVNSGSPSLTFTVTNISTVASGPVSSNILTAPFTVTGTTCAAGLNPGATCTITVKFTPTTLGPITTTLIATATPGGTATIDVFGTGVNSTDLVLNPAPTAFGSVFAGKTKDLTVIVTNPAGAQTAGPLHYTLTGDASYAVLNNGTAGDCVDTVTALPNGQTCNIRIRFTPTTFTDNGSELKSGLLTVSATPGGTVTSAITGTSVSTISISPTTKDFGLLQSGDTATQEFTVLNNAAENVTIQNAVLGGTFTAMTVVADNCTGQSLLPNAVCKVSVKFAPTVLTNDNATFTVNATNVFGRAVAQILGKGNNRAPTNEALSGTTIAENQVIGTSIGTLSTTDPDIGQTFTYALTSTTDNASFAISGTTLKSAVVFDFETKSSYSIVVRVTDQDGATFDKTFAITITNVDDPPVAVNDNATVVEDTLTPIDVLANDTDQDAGNKLVAAVTQPANGVVTITGGGASVSYKPNLNFCTSNAGSSPANDTFTYTLSPPNVAPLNPAKSTATVTVSVTCADDPPVAVTDTFTVEEDVPTSLDVLANDTDVDCGVSTGNLCGPKSIAAVTPASLGSVAIHVGSGSLDYTPPLNTCGVPATFTYTLNGGSTTTVTVNLDCVNDAPLFTKGADQTVLEDAATVTVTGWATGIAAGPANESGQTVTFIVTGDTNAALFATAPAVASNGTLTFKPAANANGAATITLVAKDNGGTANGGVDTSAAQSFTINVTAVNDAPSFTSAGDGSVLAGERGYADGRPNWATSDLAQGPADEVGVRRVSVPRSSGNRQRLACSRPAPAISPDRHVDLRARERMPPARRTITVEHQGQRRHGERRHRHVGKRRRSRSSVGQNTVGWCDASCRSRRVAPGALDFAFQACWHASNAA